ncbi:MAG: ABC transporter ATP-binding protein, partial [Alphaproteobacteria bacterium]
AVHELDLTVDEGSVFALIGANGAGKSSTIMAIAGHVDVQSGRIRFRDKDITREPAMARVRAGIAVVPEGRRLFPDLSVEENLIIGGYALPAARTPANRDLVFDLFPRLAERRMLPAGALSGGEQQMLAISRALMAEPRMLLIDEVSLGLMPKIVDQCFAVIERLREDGMTVLLVEQNTGRALAVAENFCVLESGRAVYRGTTEEARGNPALIDAYLGLSTEAVPHV